MSEARRRPRVIVVGGGISGLAAAHRVAAGAPAADVLVLEASPRIGGSLRTAEIAGVQVDVGAEAMLNRRPEGVALARAVGLADDLVHPATVKAGLWSRGRVIALPRTLMGVPLDVGSLGEVLSPRGAERAAQDRSLPPTHLEEGEDVSVGDLVEQRLGPEVVERLVEPMLGGVYAGHSHEISVRAAVPQLLSLLERDGTLSGAATVVRPGEDAGPVFAGLVDGVGRLPEVVARASGARVRTDATVREIARSPGGGWQLVVGPTREPELLQADVVVLATPARATARLLGGTAPTAARLLGEVETASMAIVTLAVPAVAFPQVVGSGFLVPPVDGRAIKASTFSFAKWDWVREAGEASPEPVRILRCSLGRHREEHMLQCSDEELVALATTDLADAIGLGVPPLDAHVQRWGGALPQYAVGHVERMASVRREIAGVTGLAVCGSTYDGVGIPACIASAHAAAAKVLGDLATMGA